MQRPLLLSAAMLCAWLGACETTTALPETSTTTQAIINGEVSAEFPAVGGLTLDGEYHCTATLVGCDTILTAAHCVCDGFNPDQCHNAADYDFFLPNAGSYKVLSVETHPDQDGFINDVAIMRLDRPVEGVRPMRMVEVEPSLGTRGTIVGYGKDSSSRFGSKAYKQVGSVVTEECHQEFFTGTFAGWDETGLCWISSDEIAGTCNGDSGGPMIVEQDGELRVASTASGALSSGGDSCQEGAQVVQNSLPRTGRFLFDAVDNTGESCSSFPEVGDANVWTESLYEHRTLGTPLEQSVDIAEGTLRLVAGAGSLSAVRLSIVKIDSESGDETTVCEVSEGYLRTCVVEAPEPGIYVARAAPHFTGEEVQLIVTAYGAETEMDGDEGCEKCDELQPSEAGGCSTSGSPTGGLGLLLLAACATLRRRVRPPLTARGA